MCVDFYLHVPVVRYHLLRYKMQEGRAVFQLVVSKKTTSRHTLAQVKEVLHGTGRESPHGGEGTGITPLFL